MKLIYFLLSIGTIIIVISLCSREASSHSNERIALYNLSTMVHGFAKQLDRIESRLGECIINKREEMK